MIPALTLTIAWTVQELAARGHNLIMLNQSLTRWGVKYVRSKATQGVDLHEFEGPLEVAAPGLVSKPHDPKEVCAQHSTALIRFLLVCHPILCPDGASLWCKVPNNLPIHM